MGDEVRLGEVDRPPHRCQARGRGRLRGAGGLRGEGLMLRRELPGGYALRLLEERDADELFALIDANRDHLAPWMPWAVAERSPADVLPFIRSTRQQIADNDGLQTAIVDGDGAIVGVVGFHAVDWMHGKTSIGYWLARDHQGRGTMTA